MKQEFRLLIQPKGPEKGHLANPHRQSLKRTRTHGLDDQPIILNPRLKDTPGRLPVDRLVVASTMNQHTTILLQNHESLTLSKITPRTACICDSASQNHNNHLPIFQ